MRRRQQGVAVVTALLLTTLAVTIVASLFWQQQVQVRSMENQRLQLQTRWILRGALDLSRLVLNQDLIDSPSITQINGVWATPLQETRLDDYVERERLQGESYDATLQGRMTDAQSRYNLANLAINRQVSRVQLAVFERLLTNLRLNPELAQGVAELVASAQIAQPAAGDNGIAGSGTGGAGSGNNGASGASGSGGAGTGGAGSGTGGSGTAADRQAAVQSGAQPVALVRVEDLLAVSGFSPQAIDQLRDFVIILPGTVETPVNVNTAPAEVISALVDGLSLSDAQSLVNTRNRGAYYRNKADFTSQQQVAGHVPTASWDVKSSYFLAYSRVKLDRAMLETQALLYRPNNIPNTSVVWIREY